MPNKNRLKKDERLYRNESIVSGNNLFRLIYQTDGNIVIYRWDGKPIWATMKFVDDAGFLTLQGDGNLVAYRKNGIPYWASMSSGNDTYLEIQDDGNLVIYDPRKGPLWASGSETTDRPKPPPYRQIRGLLRASGRLIRDDVGPVLPCFAHFGDGRALFSTNPTKVREVFETFVNHQYQGFLSWSVLNNSGQSNPWHIPPYYFLGPDVQNDFWKKSEEYARLAAEYNLVWLWSAGGLDSFTKDSFKKFIQGFIDLAHKVGPERFVFELVNELFATAPRDWWNPDLIDELCEPVRRAFPDMIVMTSSLGGIEDPNQLAPYNRKTKIISHHAFRKLHIGNKADHPWTFGYAVIPKIRQLNGNSQLIRGWNTEGCGPFSDVDKDNGSGKVKGYVSVQDNGFRNSNQFDDESMGLIALKNYAGGLAYNYFCATGVVYNRPFTDYPGFKNVAKLAQLIPQDIWNYEWLGHGGSNRPWSHMRFLEPPTDARIDGFYSNSGKAFLVMNGINNNHDREWSYRVLKNFTGKILHPGTCEMNEVSRKSGEELKIRFKWGRGLII